MSKENNKVKNRLIRVLKHQINLIIFIVLCLVVANIIVVGPSVGQIKGSLKGDAKLTEEQLQQVRDFGPECILVLGASVYRNGDPSPMLRDRLDTAVYLYEAGAAPKLLLSGDRSSDYDEVGPMLKYVKEAGVPDEDVVCDPNGFSTYESVYRAGRVYRVSKVLVVTQKYHLYRALYGCRHMNMDAIGVGSDQERYVGQFLRDGRELLARVKDLCEWIVRPEPDDLGEPQPINGE